MKISIIVPCYNAIDKIGRCLASLRNLNFDISQYEVLFVDDQSTDGTYELLEHESRHCNHWHLFRLDVNSGSPSRPRNLGIEKARGEYIYFLDCDDELFPNSLQDLYDLAIETSACLIRSELCVYDGSQVRTANTMPNWDSCSSLNERIQMIIKEQSTTVDSFIKRILLIENNIRWHEDLRMGEDTVFLAEVLINSKIIEFNKGCLYKYYKMPSLTPASTQRYGRKELGDHIKVWRSVQTILKKKGVDYYGTRLNVGLRVCLESLIFKNRSDVDVGTFESFSNFIGDQWPLIASFNYIDRYASFLEVIKIGDYSGFLKLARPRLLIAGHDLKFITDVVPELSLYFDIRVDEWTGHSSHNVDISKEKLAWADYVWCEWLLGNAEWYSNNIRTDQKLVIRMHRMELGRAHGDNLNLLNIDAVVVVSTFFFERLLERFKEIPRSKVRLIHNYIKYEEYKDGWSDQRLYNLAIIGILPSRKGLRRALEVIKLLRIFDSRYKLKVFGKKPEELSWISRDATEMKYFSECNDFIIEHKLSDAVEFIGHVNVKDALEAHSIGCVLSVSDPDDGFPGPESFHLAIADGFAGGGLSLITHWEGAEFIWPEKYIYKSVEELVLKLRQYNESKNSFQDASKEGKAIVMERYSADEFVKSVRDLYLEFN